MNEANGNSSETVEWYGKAVMIASLPLLPAIIACMGLCSYTETTYPNAEFVCECSAVAGSFACQMLVCKLPRTVGL